MTTIADITRDYAAKRDRWSRLNEQSQRFPAAVRQPSTSEFAIIMDDACKAIRDLPEFDGWTPMDWESFCELLPNMRKIMGIEHGEGSWSS
jgi:hypothetical protein